MLSLVRFVRRAALLGATLCLIASAPPAQQAATSPDAAATDAESDADILLAKLAEPWTGDLDGIVARGFLRIGVAYGAVFFTADGPKNSGINADAAAEFQKHLREKLGKEARDLTLVLAPVPRDRLVDALTEGRVDLLMANLTITPARLERVAFGDPIATNVRELLVTGPAAPAVATPDDLGDVEINVRASSSYHEHLTALDARRRAAGKPPLKIVATDENLEDEDIIELVSLGVLQATVVDEHKARVFAPIFDQAVVRDDVVINEAGDIAWAMRKDAPKLKAAVDAFMKVAKQGTRIGNTLIKRYFNDSDRARAALDAEGRSRFDEVIGLIRLHAGAYDFDALLVAAQGFQESGLDQSKRSPAGAIGVMQVMPQTARDPNVAIPDISTTTRNIEAGVKYLRFVRDRYFSDPAISRYDQTLFSFAAYNAGPGNISKARKRAEKMGLDPNVWFGNVEIATARAVSREPVVYVRNILKYYVTYRVAENRKAARGG